MNYNIPHKLCKNCKYFLKPFENDLSYGRCGRFRVFSPIDGQSHHKFAMDERKEKGSCKNLGIYYEERKEIKQE